MDISPKTMREEIFFMVSQMCKTEKDIDDAYKLTEVIFKYVIGEKIKTVERCQLINNMLIDNHKKDKGILGYSNFIQGCLSSLEGREITYNNLIDEYKKNL